MSDFYDTLCFQVHHIFPWELFESAIATELTALFAGQTDPLSLDMDGNKIALFADASMATATLDGQTGLSEKLLTSACGAVLISR